MTIKLLLGCLQGQKQFGFGVVVKDLCEKIKYHENCFLFHFPPVASIPELGEIATTTDEFGSYAALVNQLHP
jgi:hypothetical protein